MERQRDESYWLPVVAGSSAEIECYQLIRGLGLLVTIVWGKSSHIMTMSMSDSVCRKLFRQQEGLYSISY